MVLTVRSRKFCCCLPVRFGVICMALLGLVFGVALCAVGWYEVNELRLGQTQLDGGEKVGLWFVSISFTLLGLISLIGLIGSIFHLDGLVESYAWSITVNTLANMGIGIYFIWVLFHRSPTSIDNCLNAAQASSDDPSVNQWVCAKGFDVVRVIITVVFCIVWIFQIVGIFIVFDYCGQLREEQEAEWENQSIASKGSSNAPTVVVVPEVPMRTTYDSNYDKSLQARV